MLIVLAGVALWALGRGTLQPGSPLHGAREMLRDALIFLLGIFAVASFMSGCAFVLDLGEAAAAPAPCECVECRCPKKD